MELFLDAVLDDPRLDVGASPPIGVILNEKDIVDESKEMRRKRSGVDWRGRCEEIWREEKRGRLWEGGDLSV